MAMDPLFHACLQLRHGHWEQGLQKLLSFTQSSTKNDLPMLFNILHPLLRRFICQNTIHKSDSIELFYRVYGNLFELQTAFIKPVDAIQVIDDLSSFLFLLSEKDKTVEPSWNCLSDECCLVIYRTVERLLSCLTKDAVLTLYSSEQLPLLSHICSTALGMAEFSRSRAVRVQALRMIRRLTQTISQGDCVVSKRISAVVAQLLPGVSQSLYRIVTGDSKIGSTVKEAAFDSWTATFLTVFGQILDPETSCLTSGQTDDPDAQPFTDGWYTCTRNRVGKLIQLTVDNLLHVQLELDWEESHRLSAALIRWLTGILTGCPVLLQTSVGLTIRDTVVGALIAMAAESESSAPDPIDRSASSRQLAHHALTCFVQSEQVVEVQPICLSIPQSVTNSRLIRKIATTSLCDQVNSLISLSPNLLDETQLQKRLRTILGYLNFLDAESLSVLVSSRDLFHRLCTSLADLLCFNTSLVELSNDPPQLDALSSSSSVRITHMIRTVHLFTKSFTAFRDPKSLQLIQAIAGRIAGQENTIDLFLDTCRDVMNLQTGGSLRNSCILLITAGLSGYLANGSIPWEQRKADSLRVVTEYFESDLLQLPTSNVDDVNPNTLSQSIKTPSILCDSASPLQKWPMEKPTTSVDLVSVTKPSLKELKENVVTVCLLLELFGTASQIYESCPTGAHANDVCEDLLRIGLVACTSLVAHPGLIGQTARHCLRYVSLHCGFASHPIGIGHDLHITVSAFFCPSVNELITRNADFLISNITLDLHRVLLLGADQEPLTMPANLLHSLRLACQTLGTLFEHATIDVVPLLRSLVRQVLACLDLIYEHHADLFLPALKRLLNACRQWHEARQQHTPYAADRSTLLNQDVYGLVLKNVQSLVESTRNIHHLSNLNGSEPEDYTEKSPPADEAAQADENALDQSSRVYPDHLHIVEETMLRCIHLLSNTDPKLRLLSMDVLIEGYLTLANERELLLPLVHKTWSALMARFRDQHAVVVEKAFQLLTVLTRTAGDFLRARASSEVMPPLLTFLIRGAGVSAGASNSYRHLTSYRVQKQLLQQMGSLCEQLNLSSETLRSVIHVLIIYLEDEQPHGLQQASEYSLQVLWQLDFGLVWTLLSMQVPKECQDEVFGASVRDTFCYPLQIRQPSSADRRRINVARLKSILSRLYKIVPVTNPVV